MKNTIHIGKGKSSFFGVNVYMGFAVEVTSSMVVELMTELFIVPDRESLWES